MWLDGVAIGAPVLVGDVRGLPVQSGDQSSRRNRSLSQATKPGEAVNYRSSRLEQKIPPSIPSPSCASSELLKSFREEVIAQARAQADAFVEGEISADRRDLTKIVTLTIDPFDARDFDDAYLA